MPPSLLLPWWEVGAGEACNYFNCLMTQLNTRRNGGFHFHFYKTSHKAFIFTLNTGMNNSRAFLIPERASELRGDTNPQTSTQRGDKDSPLSPKAGFRGRTDRLQLLHISKHHLFFQVFQCVPLILDTFATRQSVLLLKVRV